MKTTNATIAQLAFWTLFFKLMVDRGQLGFWSGETALLLSAAVLLWALCQRRIEVVGERPLRPAGTSPKRGER